jgi:hypothetical protein
MENRQENVDKAAAEIGFYIVKFSDNYLMKNMILFFLEQLQ